MPMSEVIPPRDYALAAAVAALVAVALADQVEISILETAGLGLAAGLLTVTWMVGGHQA